MSAWTNAQNNCWIVCFRNRQTLCPSLAVVGQKHKRPIGSLTTIVLCVQDTSELDYSGQKQMKGLGPLTYEAQRGLLLHPTLAITPDRLALGVLENRIWARDIETYGKGKQRASKSIEEKESFRWIEGYVQICQISHSLPDTQCVYVADRESDIYELFIEAEQQQNPADFLVRASHDRIACLMTVD